MGTQVEDWTRSEAAALSEPRSVTAAEVTAPSGDVGADVQDWDEVVVVLDANTAAVVTAQPWLQFGKYNVGSGPVSRWAPGKPIESVGCGGYIATQSQDASFIVNTRGADRLQVLINDIGGATTVYIKLYGFTKQGAAAGSSSGGGGGGSDKVQGKAAHDAANAGNPVKIGARYQAGTPDTVNDDDAADVLCDDSGRLVTLVRGSDVAHDAADAGNPLKVGGKAATSAPAAVSNGDRVDAYFDANGRLGVFASGDVANDAADAGNPVKIGGRVNTVMAALGSSGDRVDANFDTYGRQFGVVCGDRAHDAVETAVDYPVKIGGKAQSAIPSAVANNDRVNAYFDLNGRLVTVATGDVAHDAVDSGSPVKIGGKASTSTPTAVANADRVDAFFDEYGRLHTRDIAYDESLGALVVAPASDMADRWVPAEELVDTTNIAAATYYYPSSDGLEMEEYDHLSIQMVMSGGVTVTIEAWNDDAGDVIDITKSALSMLNGVTGAASYVDQSDILDLEGLNVEKVRIKVVTSDATNGVQLHIRRRKK